MVNVAKQLGDVDRGIVRLPAKLPVRTLDVGDQPFRLRPIGVGSEIDSLRRLEGGQTRIEKASRLGPYVF
jgi:hypothetical protein